MALTLEQYQRINDYLLQFYEQPLYERHGQSHPLLWYPAPLHAAPDSVLGRQPTQTNIDDKFLIYDYGYLHSLQNGKRHLFNGTTFALKHFNPRTLKVEAVLGKYFDSIATCYALENELLAASQRRFIRLPLRSQYHREISPRRALVSGEGRSAAIGGGALLVFNDNGTYRCLINQRKSSQATRPNSLHVIPAFMFQPMGETVHTQEWSIAHHVYREYLEELFGMAESDNLDFSQHPAMRDLQQMQAAGLADLHLLGVSFNLLTMRVEISTLLLIHDSEWWQRVHAVDSTFPLSLPESEGNLIYAPLATDDDVLAALPESYYLNMPPQAIAILWAGIDLARTLINL